MTTAPDTPRLPDRYTVTENRDGLGFSNGISQSDDGEYVSIRDYDALHLDYAGTMSVNEDLARDIAALRKQVEAAEKLDSAADLVINDAERLGDYEQPMAFLQVSSLNTLNRALSAYRATVSA
jgi:hypothetical protein